MENVTDRNVCCSECRNRPNLSLSVTAMATTATITAVLLL
jgi:hypothetical protein